jgi:hypothetical protein
MFEILAIGNPSSSQAAFADPVIYAQPRRPAQLVKVAADCQDLCFVSGTKERKGIAEVGAMAACR